MPHAPDAQADGRTRPRLQSDLQTLFAAFGEVEEVHIQRNDMGTSKGFGSVRFRRDEDAAKALQGLNGRDVAGLPLRVRACRQRRPSRAPVLTLLPAQVSVMGDSGASQDATWRLDDDDEGGLQMNAQARAALMARLASAGAPPAAPIIPPPAPVQAVPPPPPPVEGAPSQFVQLRNMFNPAEESAPGWDADIRDDVEDECGRYGRVLHCAVDKHSQGHCYIMFADVGAAQQAVAALNGRFFAGRTISVAYMRREQYQLRFPEVAEL